MSVILKTFTRARILIKINQMYTKNIRPAIYRSVDGSVGKYIPHKRHYKAGFEMSELFEMSVQTDNIIIDIEQCAKQFPIHCVSLVGEDIQRPGVVDSLYLCYKPHIAKPGDQTGSIKTGL